MALTDVLADWMLRSLARRYDTPAEAIEAFASRLGVDVWFTPHTAAESVLEDADEPILELDGEAILLDPEELRGADREDQLEHLADLAERLDLPREAWCVDPIKKIERLEDDPTRAYLWLLGDRATGDDVSRLQRALTERYRDEYGREPAALHLIVRDVDDIKEIPSEVIEHTIKPWLKDREEALDRATDEGESRETEV